MRGVCESRSEACVRLRVRVRVRVSGWMSGGEQVAEWEVPWVGKAESDKC